MSYSIVKRLIIKDWFLLRWSIGGYLVAGAIALVLLGTGGPGSFYAGTILLITVTITLGIHLAMVTVLTERTEQTLPFIMSLPISGADYTAAKIAANLSLFLLPWTALTIGTVGVLGGSTARGNGGLIPIAVLTLVELLAAYCLLLFIALVTESQGWTISVMVAANLFLQGFLYFVSRVPSIASGMKGHHAVWSQAAITLLLAQVGVIFLLLALTFVFRARKTDFL